MWAPVAGEAAAAYAIQVAACESGRDAQGQLDGNFATNGAHFGLFQISSIHAGRWPDFFTAWSDPRRNAEMALDIYGTSGWTPWQCA